MVEDGDGFELPPSVRRSAQSDWSQSRLLLSCWCPGEGALGDAVLPRSRQRLVMFAAVHRWRLKPGMEDQLVEGWERGAHARSGASAAATGRAYAERSDDDGSSPGFLAWRTSLLGSDGPLVDLGCGPGRDLAAFTTARIQCVGVDLSEGMLTIAARRACRWSGGIYGHRQFARAQ